MLELLRHNHIDMPGLAPRLADDVHGRSFALGVKRYFDVFAALLGMLVLAPFFAVLAVAIKLDSPGAVFFKQRRVGLNGAPFDMYKFRSMRSGASDREHREYVTRMIREGGEELRNGNGTYKLENDSRITRVGAWLRRSSLDELAQLINVVRGEMSLVGPRPPLPYEVALYGPRDLRRLTVTPGITGLWQVSGRNETSFDEMVELDLDYIENWSLANDIHIIARTVLVLVKERGA